MVYLEISPPAWGWPEIALRTRFISRDFPTRVGMARRQGEHSAITTSGTNVIRVAYDTIMGSPSALGQLRETIWHETMHWIHHQGPQVYGDLITQHYRARTAAEPLVPSQYGGVGRKDRWWDEYAGKQYVGAAFDPEPEGRGVELATRYFQLLANPERFVRQLDPIFEANADVFLDTLKIALKIFTDGIQ